MHAHALKLYDLHEISVDVLIFSYLGVKCPTDKYLCDYGATCISKDLLCNGNRDCRDGSDETDCSTSKYNVSLKNRQYKFYFSRVFFVLF